MSGRSVGKMFLMMQFEKIQNKTSAG